MNFVDESGKAINHLSVERNEQLQAGRYIRPESVVLELGARYGTVSCVINSKLAVKTNQVSVEPDSRVHAALELNMRANGCEFHIVKGVISRTPIVLDALDYYNGYGTTSVKAETSSIVSYRLEDIEAMYGLTFDTLVADCEGFLEQFFDENPDFYKQLRLIIFEQDYPKKCNYAKITGVLRQQGFVQLEAGFHQVWRRPTAGP
jgi:FkbM family methyltransferase